MILCSVSYFIKNWRIKEYLQTDKTEEEYTE